MDVKQTKYTIKNCPPRQSILVESDHGYGKSSVIAQVAAELSAETGKPFQFIDFRLSQKEVADLLGMMRSGNFKTTRRVFTNGTETQEEISLKDVTFYDRPFWWPAEGTCGLLFLDEMNRAAREVQQVVFELAYDYRLNFNELPMGWRVITAINGNMDKYSVQSIDPALYDRFLKIKFEPTVEDWLEWAKENRIHPAVVKYIESFGEKDLFPPLEIEPGIIYPSPRAWAKLANTISYMGSNGQNVLADAGYLILLSKGFVGDVAVNFSDFIQKQYQVFKPEEILNRFEKIRNNFTDMQASEICFYADSLIDYIDKLGKLTREQSTNLLEFVKTISREAAVAFWTKFGQGKAKEIALKWYDTKGLGIGDYLTSLIARDLAVK